MSATRRALSYAAVAGFTFLAGALLHVAASRQPVAVLIPDTLSPPHYAVCAPLDSAGLRYGVRWWPARQVDR